MDFKALYTNWIDENGGVKSAISNTEESDLIKQSISDKLLKPGHIYRFDYLDKKSVTEMMNHKSKNLYYDTKPIILSLGQDHKLGAEVGVNLNVLPYQVKFNLFSCPSATYQRKNAEVRHCF